MGDKKCWRCESDEHYLFHDPMMPSWDRLGLCRPCVIERRAVVERYMDLGDDLVPYQIEGDVVTK